MTNSEWFNRLLAKEGTDATWRPIENPIVLERGKGSLIWDVEGHSYIDMVAGFGSLPLGHNSSEVKSKLNEDDDSLMQGMGDVYPSRFKIEFIEKIHSFLPEYLNRSLLAVTGSQAVEIAMKTAMLASGGTGFISFQGAYHGLDLGPLALTNNPHFRSSFSPWLNRFNVQHLPFMCDPDVIVQAIREFQAQSIPFAGIVVEPIQGRGGFKEASLEWLRSLKGIAEKEGGLLIYDEVFSGFGRSGRVTFAEEAPCDLVCFGKAIGGGMPISACVGTEQAMKAWPVNGGEAIHTGTFFGHPYSCRNGIATLDLIRERNLVGRSQLLGSQVLQKLKNRLAHSNLIREIRGSGLMIAVEFKKAEDSLRAMTELKSKGVFVIPCGPYGECVSWTPALNIEESLLDQAIDRLVEITDWLEKRL